MLKNIIIIQCNLRNSCSIQFQNFVIVTGGHVDVNGITDGKQATQYFADGTSTDLPNLLIPRKDHSCGSYIRQDGTQAKMFSLFIINHFSHFLALSINKKFRC